MRTLQPVTNDTVVVCDVSRSPGMSCRLTWYPPHYVQPRHLHTCTEVSLLLAGSFKETACGRELQPTHCSFAAKPAGAEHAVAFGVNGALILSFNLSTSDDEVTTEVLPRIWTWHEAERARPLITTFTRPLGGASRLVAEHLEDAMWDLLSVIDAPVPPPPCSDPPRWLCRLREALDDAPADVRVALAAHKAGVHRTHLARLFRRHYGVPVSIYRRRTLVAAAVRQVAEGRSLAAAAGAAGFSDQSHMTRTMTAEIGLTPGNLSRLLASPVKRHR
jgi:AraC family transcriptional regulator